MPKAEGKLTVLPSRWSIFIGLFIVAAMCAGAWFLAPKGENQVLVPRLPLHPSKAAVC